MKLKFRHVLLLMVSVLLVSSCVSRKEIAYFQGIENLVSEVNLEPIRFKENDLLSITVSAANLESVLPFNLLLYSRATSNRSPESFNSNNTYEVGYLVDSDGEINFPVLGSIRVKGLTPKELHEYLTKQLEEYILNPIVNIRILNFRISILGEVQRPGTYMVPGERIALPEALGLAGDLSIFGMRDNILVIRETDSIKTYKYLNLLDADVLNSDFYYLQQNDVVYVEPNKAQRQSSSFNRNASVYVSIASLLISVLVIIFR